MGEGEEEGEEMAFVLLARKGWARRSSAGGRSEGWFLTMDRTRLTADSNSSRERLTLLNSVESLAPSLFCCC